MRSKLIRIKSRHFFIQMLETQQYTYSLIIMIIIIIILIQIKTLFRQATYLTR